MLCRDLVFSSVSNRYSVLGCSSDKWHKLSAEWHRVQGVLGTQFHQHIRWHNYTIMHATVVAGEAESIFIYFFLILKRVSTSRSRFQA